MGNPACKTLEELQAVRDGLYLAGTTPLLHGKAFLWAAHEALGTSGCVTLELQRLREERDQAIETRTALETQLTVLQKAYEALRSVAEDGSRNELEEFLFDLSHPEGAD